MNLNLIGEGTRGEPSSNGGCADVAGKLEAGTLSVRPAGDNVNVEGVLDSSNGASGQHHLLPGLLQVDDVNTIVLKHN